MLQEKELSFDLPPSTRAEEFKRKIIEKLSESGGEIGKTVTATSMVRLFYLGREIGGKNGDNKLEDYKIVPTADAHIVIMNINVGQSAPGPSEKTSNCPCSIM